VNVINKTDHMQLLRVIKTDLFAKTIFRVVGSLPSIDVNEHGMYTCFYSIVESEMQQSQHTEKFTVRYFHHLHNKISITWLLVFIQLFSWDYIINRTLHGGLKIWLLSSRVKTKFNSLAALLRKILFSPLEDKSHIFASTLNRSRFHVFLYFIKFIKKFLI
jgi:hypothetical protein